MSQLSDLCMLYRGSHGLPAIPGNLSLSFCCFFLHLSLYPAQCSHTPSSVYLVTLIVDIHSGIDPFLLLAYCPQLLFGRPVPGCVVPHKNVVVFLWK